MYKKVIVSVIMRKNEQKSQILRRCTKRRTPGTNTKKHHNKIIHENSQNYQIKLRRYKQSKQYDNLFAHKTKLIQGIPPKLPNKIEVKHKTKHKTILYFLNSINLVELR